MADLPKILVLTGQHAQRPMVLDLLRSHTAVHECQSIDDALTELRRNAGEIAGVFSDAEDFLPLERALISQQATLVLNTIGEGVCIVDPSGRCNWMNKKMSAWPAHVHEAVRRACTEAFDHFGKMSPTELTSPTAARSRRFSLNLEDQQYMDLIASPVTTPSGQVVQIVAVVWDATNTSKLQQKIDAIDRAGSELMQLEAESIKDLHAADRLKLLEKKIVGYARELMRFDHFAIRLINRKTQQLETVMYAGLPPDALNLPLLARAEGNGISGFVAATGRSYICSDVKRDPRYVTGLDQAASSITVPLKLHDKVMGIFNVESRQLAAFNEDDRQFLEIFGRYIAMALNTLDLMVKERVETSHKVTDTVCAEVALPLNELHMDLTSLKEDLADQPEVYDRIASMMQKVESVRTSLTQAAEGTNAMMIGAQEMKDRHTIADPVIASARILVVDDEPNMRQTVADILRLHNANVTICKGGQEAMEAIRQEDFDLTISDVNMPDATGYQVFSEVRRKPHPWPVILMTAFGYDRSHEICRATQEGVAAVLLKPFRAEHFLDEVRKALAHRPAEIVQ
jgi:two-component system, sensor histidine kinase SagS